MSARNKRKNAKAKIVPQPLPEKNYVDKSEFLPADVEDHVYNVRNRFPVMSYYAVRHAASSLFDTHIIKQSLQKTKKSKAIFEVLMGNKSSVYRTLDMFSSFYVFPQSYCDNYRSLRQEYAIKFSRDPTGRLRPRPRRRRFPDMWNWSNETRKKSVSAISTSVVVKKSTGGVIKRDGSKSKTLSKKIADKSLKRCIIQQKATPKRAIRRPQRYVEYEEISIEENKQRRIDTVEIMDVKRRRKIPSRLKDCFMDTTSLEGMPMIESDTGTDSEMVTKFSDDGPMINGKSGKRFNHEHNENSGNENSNSEKTTKRKRIAPNVSISITDKVQQPTHSKMAPDLVATKKNQSCSTPNPEAQLEENLIQLLKGVPHGRVESDDGVFIIKRLPINGFQLLKQKIGLSHFFIKSVHKQSLFVQVILEPKVTNYSRTTDSHAKPLVQTNSYATAPTQSSSMTTFATSTHLPMSTAVSGDFVTEDSFVGGIVISDAIHTSDGNNMGLPSVHNIKFKPQSVKKMYTANARKVPILHRSRITFPNSTVPALSSQNSSNGVLSSVDGSGTSQAYCSSELTASQLLVMRQNKGSAQSTIKYSELSRDCRPNSLSHNFDHSSYHSVSSASTSFRNTDYSTFSIADSNRINSIGEGNHMEIMALSADLPSSSVTDIVGSGSTLSGGSRRVVHRILPTASSTTSSVSPMGATMGTEYRSDGSVVMTAVSQQQQYFQQHPLSRRPILRQTPATCSSLRAPFPTIPRHPVYPNHMPMSLTRQFYATQQLQRMGINMGVVPSPGRPPLVGSRPYKVPGLPNANSSKQSGQWQIGTSSTMQQK